MEQTRTTTVKITVNARLGEKLVPCILEALLLSDEKNADIELVHNDYKYDINEWARERLSEICSSIDINKQKIDVGETE